ncbi:MAG: hypothetical protein HY652_04990 [Acidobacteria bacterium]|nr:hypothetical protein [Acidobacteriota bacterium]
MIGVRQGNRDRLVRRNRQAGGEHDVAATTEAVVIKAFVAGLVGRSRRVLEGNKQVGNDEIPTSAQQEQEGSDTEDLLPGTHGSSCNAPVQHARYYKPGDFKNVRKRAEPMLPCSKSASKFPLTLEYTIGFTLVEDR